MSDVKTPASVSRYFDFEIQEEAETRRVVCVSPEKYDVIKEKQHSKSPTHTVSVSPQKRKYHPDSTEYKMKNYLKVLVARNLAFPWIEMPGEEHEATVMEILNSSVVGDIVLLKAKVVSKGDSENVFSSRMQRELTKCDIVLADMSGSIQAVVWEDFNNFRRRVVRL